MLSPKMVSPRMSHKSPINFNKSQNISKNEDCEVLDDSEGEQAITHGFLPRRKSGLSSRQGQIMGQHNKVQSSAEGKRSHRNNMMDDTEGESVIIGDEEPPA